MLHTGLIKKEQSARAFQPVGRQLQRKCACGQHTIGGGKCDECSKGQQLQRHPAHTAVRNDKARKVPPIVHEVLGSSGQPLDASTRAFMESRFGQDFSHVRVHTDERAAESARAVNALAYTAGHDVVFQAGQYAAGTSEGRRLIAHELAHVVQQGGAHSELPLMSSVSQPSDAAEVEADRIATDIVNAPPLLANVNPGGVTRHMGDKGAHVPSLISTPPDVIHRVDWYMGVNGRVINNSEEMVTVWSDRNGRYVIPRHTSSDHFGEDVDHVRDRWGQWYKIGPYTVTVDAAGHVHGYLCRVGGPGAECPGNIHSPMSGVSPFRLR